MRGRQPSRERLTLRSSYQRLFRIHVHLLIAWGFGDGRKRIRSDHEEEPDITSFICDAIQDRLRAADPPSWCRFYSVKENPPVRDGSRTGKSKPKPDVIIEWTRFVGRPEYVFEAKRLGGSRHGASEYMGADGMGCFIGGTYAARYDEAGMLGYVQVGTVSQWRDGLKSAIDRKRVTLRLRAPQRDETVVDALPLEWGSDHDRGATGRPISLRHILLDCRPATQGHSRERG